VVQIFQFLGQLSLQVFIAMLRHLPPMQQIEAAMACGRVRCGSMRRKIEWYQSIPVCFTGVNVMRQTCVQRSVQRSIIALLWGWNAEVCILRIFKTLQVSLKNAEINDRPSSVIKVDPVSCRVTICVAHTLAHISAV
jgi:hypothetical protein